MPKVKYIGQKEEYTDILTKEDIEAFQIENEELESWEVIRSEGEGYWLCYRGYQVTYTDETGLEHPCKVIL